MRPSSLKCLPSLLFLVLVEACSTGVLAEDGESSSNCEQYKVFANTNGNNPCDIALNLRTPCEPEVNVTAPAYTECSCNTVVYNLASACSICLSHWDPDTSDDSDDSEDLPDSISTFPGYRNWTSECQAQWKAPEGSYPLFDDNGTGNVSKDAVDVPNWAFIPLDSQGKFNVQKAMNVANPPPISWSALQIALPISVSLVLLIGFTTFYLYRHYRKHHALPYQWSHFFLSIAAFFALFGCSCARRVKRARRAQEWDIDGAAEDRAREHSRRDEDGEASIPMMSHTRSGSSMSNATFATNDTGNTGTTTGRGSVTSRARARGAAIEWGLDKWVLGPMKALFGGRRIMPVRKRQTSDGFSIDEDAIGGNDIRAESGSGSGSGRTGAGTGVGSGTAGSSWRSWWAHSVGRSRGTPSSERSSRGKRPRTRNGSDTTRITVDRTPTRLPSDHDEQDLEGHAYGPVAGPSGSGVSWSRGPGPYVPISNLRSSPDDEDRENIIFDYDDPGDQNNHNRHPPHTLAVNTDPTDNHDHGEDESNEAPPSVILISKTGENFSINTHSALSPSASMSVSTPHPTSSGKSGRASKGSMMATASGSGHSGPGPGEASGSGSGQRGGPPSSWERRNVRQDTVMSIGTEATVGSGVAFQPNLPRAHGAGSRAPPVLQPSLPSLPLPSAFGTGQGRSSSPPPMLRKADGNEYGPANMAQPLEDGGVQVTRGAGGGTIGTVRSMATDATARSGTLSPSASVAFTSGPSSYSQGQGQGRKGAYGVGGGAGGPGNAGRIRPGTIDTLGTEATFSTKATNGSSQSSMHGGGQGSSLFPSASLSKSSTAHATSTPAVDASLRRADGVYVNGEGEMQSPKDMEDWSNAPGTVKQRDRSSVEVVPPTPATWREDPFVSYVPPQPQPTPPPPPPPPPQLMTPSSSSSPGLQPSTTMQSPWYHPYQSRHPALSTIASVPSSSSVALASTASPASVAIPLHTQHSKPDLQRSPNAVPRSLGHKPSAESTSSAMKKGRANRPPPFASFSVTSSSPDLAMHNGQESSSSLIAEGNEAEVGYLPESGDQYAQHRGHVRNGSSSTSPALATGLSRQFMDTSPEYGSLQTATQATFSPPLRPPTQSPPYTSAHTHSHMRQYSNHSYESSSSHHLSPLHSPSLSPGQPLVSPYSPPVPLSPPQSSTITHVRTTSNPHVRQLPPIPTQQPQPQARSPPPQLLRFHSGSPSNPPIDPDSLSNLLPTSVRSAGYNPFQPVAYQNGEQAHGQGYANTSPGSVARYGGYGEGMDALAVLETPENAADYR